MSRQAKRFKVTLPSHDNYTQVYSRDRFIEMFPCSPISLALQDPTAETIEITVPAVTPYVLEYLSNWVETQALSIPTENLSAAGRYLLIPWLLIASSPLYPQLMAKHPKFDTDDPESVTQCLVFAIKHDWYELYALCRDTILEIYPDAVPESYKFIAVITAYYDRPNLYPWRDAFYPTITSVSFLKHIQEAATEVEIFTSRLPSGVVLGINVIDAAIYGRSCTILERLVSKYKDDIKSSTYLPFMTILNFPEGIDLFLSHSDAEPEVINQCLAYAMSRDKDYIPVMGHLLRVGPDPKDIFTKAFEENRHRVIGFLSHCYPELLREVIPSILADQLTQILPHMVRETIHQCVIMTLDYQRHDLLHIIRTRLPGREMYALVKDHVNWKDHMNPFTPEEIAEFEGPSLEDRLGHFIEHM